MQVLDSGQQLAAGISCVVTVGNFDGVHKGHAMLMAEIVKRARSRGVASAVVTFEPHTRVILNPDLPTERLTTFDEKVHLIERCGVDYLVCMKFTPELSRESPESFVASVLANQLHSVEWVMGEGHGIGKDRSGGKNFLRTVLGKYHIIPFTADLLKNDDAIISSTQVRVQIVKGRLSDAVAMLGHPYLISVERIQGLKVGSQLGFPTLNFSRPTSQKVVPPPGVYAAELEYKGCVQTGALYFGDCPTFTGRSVHFEFHAFEHEKPFPDIGENAKLWLGDFIRADRTFSTTGELVAQIENDVKTIQNFFRGERSCH
jgi:riboflavin kinase/FMN adenylyltransferase